MPIFFRCHKTLRICKTTAQDLRVGSLFSSSMKEVFAINTHYHCNLYFYPALINNVTGCFCYNYITIIIRYHHGMIYLTTGRARFYNQKWSYSNSHQLGGKSLGSFFDLHKGWNFLLSLKRISNDDVGRKLSF